MKRIESDHEEMQVINRAVNLVEVKESKGENLELGEKHDPMFVLFSNKSCKIMFKDRKKIKVKLKSVNQMSLEGVFECHV